MKIIFLDIDGVLNGDDWLTLTGCDTSKPLSYFQPDCCARLQRILDATGAKVVISSSWRRMFSLDEIRGFLAESGVTADVIDHTIVRFSMCYRAYEIDRWLDENSCEVYCVLDDIKMPEHRDNQVLTTERIGLTDSDVERAIAILGRIGQ